METLKILTSSCIQLWCNNWKPAGNSGSTSLVIETIEWLNNVRFWFYRFCSYPTLLWRHQIMYLLYCNMYREVVLSNGCNNDIVYEYCIVYTSHFHKVFLSGYQQLAKNILYLVKWRLSSLSELTPHQYYQS